MIEINENWAVGGDDTCLTLYKKGHYGENHKNYGQSYWRATAHFGAGRYDQALEYMVDLSLSGLKSFEEIVQIANGLKKDIQKLDLSCCARQEGP